MSRCLLMARRGLGWVSPNPLVGAVIAHGRTVIADGYHEKLGGPHAEVSALARAKIPVRGATLYVNLEPCDHQGRTPPCTDQIIAAGIKRVVVGMVDPNPKVSGRGIAKLRHAGIRVTVGVREAECRSLNRIFVHWITTGTPYIAAKIAIGSDWKIAAAPGVRTNITGMEAQRKVHELRQTYDAILVGAGTVITDDPALTVRHYPERPRDPRRIILDSTLKLPLGSKVLADDTALVATTKDADPAVLASLRSLGIPVLVTDRQEGRVNVGEVLAWCAQQGITSVLVEGGREVLDSFSRAGLIRRWHVFIASRPLGHTGVDALTDLAPLQRCVHRTTPQFYGLDVLYECDPARP